MIFSSEADLHSAVTAFFTRLEIPHKNQYPVADGFADVCLELPDGRPWGLLELKKDLDTHGLQLSSAADFFEQAMKYRLASGLPVFIGPFFDNSMGVVSAYLDGGAQPRAISALSALGGRVDVGLFFLHAITGYEGRPVGWFGFQMLLRQQRVAVHSGDFSSTVWPQEPLPMVSLSSAGSRKDRVIA